MKPLLRRTGLSTLAHHLGRRPFRAWQRLMAAGGPIATWRTARGRQAMEAAAYTLTPLEGRAGSATLVVHLLTGRKFWYQTAFCLWTLARQSGRRLAPILYDDGSLDESLRDQLRRLFPSVRIVEPAETHARLESLLPAARFPILRERWLNYPNLRKLIDPHLGGADWKLVLDSDLLFFRSPRFLLDWLEQPTRPLHAVDCESSYGYSRALMQELTGAPIAEKLNVGLIGLQGAALDWDKIEFWCATLMAREGPNYYLEQALVAMLLASTSCAIAPADDYVTLPMKPESWQCRAVMHHYVAHSKRWYFQHNWRRALTSPIPS